MTKIVITGFMGSGKTRIARELARRLNLTMLDLDERITEKEGRSPAQLIDNLGEAVFRMMESDALREVFETDVAEVIALGGGAWIQETNRELVRQYGCLSVWLDVPFAMCWSRIETSVEDRPLARTRNQALTLYKRRRPIYQLAEMHIRPDENIEDLLQKVQARFV